MGTSEGPSPPRRGARHPRGRNGTRHGGKGRRGGKGPRTSTAGPEED